jgi:hypothetical protein
LFLIYKMDTSAVFSTTNELDGLLEGSNFDIGLSGFKARCRGGAGEVSYI